MSSGKNGSTSLLEVLEKATPEDLEDIDREIEAHTRKLDSLRAVRRILDVKFNGQPKKKPGPAPGSNAKGAKVTAYRTAAAKYLLHAGATRQALLAEACGIPNGSTTATFDHPWFERTPSGIVLSKEGQRAAGA